jgi:3',5'-cyclic AMP phosphodiesterase CpdA
VTDPRLLAVSDLHVRYPENRAVVEGLRPGSDGDWLIVAGDVAEQVADVEWALRLLRERFARVVWVPGNHELWTRPKDPVELRGEHRYRHLVQTCRSIDVLTPEDPFPVWDGPGGPATVAPLFLLYDYTFLPAGTSTGEEGLATARKAGVVCTDEHLLHPDPFPDRAAWCAARVAESTRRLADVPPELPTVLVNHWPLTRLPTRVLRYPEFALWCGTVHSADWHVRYRATAVVYGHLHIPRITWEDGVRFVEASLGYPREWRPREHRNGTAVADLLPRQVLPAPPGPSPSGAA